MLEAIQEQEFRLRCDNTRHSCVSWRCCDLPQVLKAIQDQEKRLQHTTTIYLHNEVAQYAKELTDRMPGNLKASVESCESVGRDICRLRLTEGGAVRQGARRSHARQPGGGWQSRPVIRINL